MVNDNRGGRGRKVPYDTVNVRIPMPLVNLINGLSLTYIGYKLTDLGKNKSDADIITLIIADMHRKNLDDISAIARKIVAHKKSAKITTKNLLQVLYSCKLDDNLYPIEKNND